jgi:hypothetical protein
VDNPVTALIAHEPLTNLIAAVMGEMQLIAEPVDKDTAEVCIAMRSRLSGTVAEVERVRKSLTQPLDWAIKEAIAKERELCKDIHEAIGFIDLALQGYQAAINRENAVREAAARAEAARIAEADKAAGLEVRDTPAILVHTPVLETAKVPTRKVPRLVVDDASLIPREYLVLDEKKLLAVLKADVVVPGAHVEYDEKIVNKRG